MVFGDSLSQPLGKPERWWSLQFLWEGPPHCYIKCGFPSSVALTSTCLISCPLFLDYRETRPFPIGS